MSTPIDDGGPAFPHSGEIAPSGQRASSEQIGMALRDWFAGQETLPDCNDVSNGFMVALTGSEPPKDPIEWWKWEAAWRAKLKLIRADALIEARKVKTP